jgi:hypothetical protein
MRLYVAFLILLVFVSFAYAFHYVGESFIAVHDKNAVGLNEEKVQLREDGSSQFPGLPMDWGNSASLITDQVSDSMITKYMNRLVDFRTRFTCTDSNLASSQWIYDKFIEFGFTDVSLDSFSLSHTMFPCEWAVNVVAVKPGSLDPDRCIIIGGHFDSVTYNSPCHPDTLAPGADDNASGIVAAMEAARVLAAAENDITLIFIAFGAEEAYRPWDHWMIGSEHYAEEAYNAGMDIKVVINLDVVSYLPGTSRDVRISEGLYIDEYSVIFAEMADAFTTLIPRIEVGTPGSDELPFQDRGYSTIFIAEYEYSPHWHGCADTMGYVDIDYMTEITEMLALSTQALANMPEPPTGISVENGNDGSSLCLSWDPNPESDVTGYHLYWGTEQGVYDSMRTVTETADTLRNLTHGEICYVGISAFDGSGYESFLTEDEGTPLGLEDGTIPGLPRAFSLSQNYPNPFNPSTTIEYDIPEGSLTMPVRIFVYDVRGRLVNMLVDEDRDPGHYTVHWDGRDYRGQQVSSGVYMYLIEAGRFSTARKMLLMK